MTSRTLKIEGMTCAACSKAVERVSKKLDGVTEASVNLATEKLNINFDESKVNIQDIQAAIEKAGYKALMEATNKTLKIEGMTCAACSKAVERVAKKLDGVLEANVNLATEKLNVSFEPSKVKLSDIKKAIEKAGYKALEEESTVDTDKEKKEKEIKALWNRFLVSAIFAVPLLIIAMGPMIGEKLGYMLPPVIDPM
ncbi:MAG: copper ion binding protein, partial [Clostridiaceae bacterium]|nr:copper ion binding protein [Clostridiaceae bacterium]